MCSFGFIRGAPVADEPVAEVLESLKDTHRRLYARLLESRSGEAPSFGSDKEREEFIASASKLVADLKRIVPGVQLLADYTWVINATLQWQVAFSTLLDIPKAVEIPTPPDGLRTPALQSAREDLSERVSEIARLVRYFRVLGEVESRLVLSNEHEKNADWFHAKIYVAGEILSGDRGRVNRLTRGSFEELETVWLREVIQLKAYLIWEKKGGEYERPEEFSKGDFLDACEFYRRRLADQDIKQGPENFGNVREYLERKYLDATGKRLREDKATELISSKARQYWIVKGQKEEDAAEEKERNWHEAEQYVMSFYENVIPAVIKPDAQSIEGIRDAIKWSEGAESRLSIMNALEAAICIYFVKGIEYSAIPWKASR